MPRMSSRRKSFRRRRTGRRSHAMSTRSLAVRALRATDQERKFHDQIFDNELINDTTTGAAIFPLNTMGDGTTNESRIGRKIAMRSIYLQFRIEKSSTAVSRSSYVRMLLILDKQPNGTLPSWANILDLPGTGNPEVEMWSPNNLNNSKRFVTLIDHRLALHKDFVEGKIYKKYLRLSQTVQYNGTGNTIGNLATNSLLLCFVGAVTTGGNVSNFSGTTRLRFVG